VEAGTATGGSVPGDAAGTGAGGGSGANDAAGGSPQADAGAADSSTGGTFVLTSSAFQAGSVVPVMYKCTGQNVSPPLAWTSAPPGTQSFAITLVHNAPDMSIHWVLWDIPAATTALQENVARMPNPPVPVGSKQVISNVDGATWYGYQGPCPQSGTQSYVFSVYALDVMTLPGVTTMSTSAAVLSVIQKHQLARATLSGTQTH
jgi:Raf kinase inhibitor-like YbhB/YbcL family protein